MQFLHVIFVAAIAILQASSDYVLVRSVTGPNTIVASNVGRVRLHGIDTSTSFDRQARDRLAGLVLNRWVRLEHEDDEPRASGRHSGYVVTGDGTFVNAVLVREGLARVSARAPRTSSTRLAELQRAEAEAQAFRRGIWGGAANIPRARYKR
jgi:endonuclease YncB( thermonuclease family)